MTESTKPSEALAGEEPQRLRCVRQRRRCWRCGTTFYVLINPYELDPYYLFRCDHCNRYRFLDADEIDQLAIVYDKVVRRGRPPIAWGPQGSQREFNKFLKFFVRHWVNRCECGGRYHHSWRAPVQCPKCKARSPRFWLWPDDVITSEPLPKLLFTLPSAEPEFNK